MSACDGPLQGFPRDLQTFFFTQYVALLEDDYPFVLWPDSRGPLSSEVEHLGFLDTISSEWPEYPLECGDLRIVSGLEEPGGFQVGEDGRVGAFRSQYTPVLLAAETRGNIFFQTVRASSVSVAIVGSDFEIADVVDAETRQLTPNAMEVAQERWSIFDRWFDINLADKGFSVTATETCDGFQIFHIEIE